MANMNKITVDGCRDALLESGEKASRKFLSDLFKVDLTVFVKRIIAITKNTSFAGICWAPHRDHFVCSLHGSVCGRQGV
jgi:hypothetical protein